MQFSLSRINGDILKSILHENSHQIELVEKPINTTKPGLVRVRIGSWGDHFCPRLISLDRDMLKTSNLLQW